jgi:hypothetical protein
MRYQPRRYNFRAVLWHGDIDDLPSDWLDNGLLTLEPDGSLVLATLRGPATAPPDGEWYIREHAEHVHEDELWPVRRDIFEAQYQAVPE